MTMTLLPLARPAFRRLRPVATAVLSSSQVGVGGAGSATGEELTGGVWVPDPEGRDANTVGFTQLVFDPAEDDALHLSAVLGFLGITAVVRPDGCPGRYEATFLEGWMTFTCVGAPHDQRLLVAMVNPRTGRGAEGWYVLDRRGRHPAGGGRP